MSDKTVRPINVPRYNWITRPTVVLPGSHGTISGTAINDWIGEDGLSIYAPRPAADDVSEDVSAD